MGANPIRPSGRSAESNQGDEGGNEFVEILWRKPYRIVTGHACRRLRQWLRAKHKLPGQGLSRFPDAILHDELGLVRLRLCDRRIPWANP